MRRWQLRTLGFAIFATAVAGVAPVAHAQTPRAVVGVPIENGKAGKPAAGVIVDVQQPDTPRERVGAPVIIQDGSQGGTTTVRPNFGGGYTVEQDGKPTTTVKPKFGGGYQVQENGKTTTEVTPRFGGGYDVKTKPGASTTVVVPPPDR